MKKIFLRSMFSKKKLRICRTAADLLMRLDIGGISGLYKERSVLFPELKGSTVDNKKAIKTPILIDVHKFEKNNKILLKYIKKTG